MLIQRLVLLFFLLLPGLARADAMRVELIGGKIETQANGDVVLVLDVAPSRLTQIARMSRSQLKTWGDVRQREPVLQTVFLNGLVLHDSGRLTAPNEVRIPALDTESDQTALPAFVPVKVTWKNVGLLHMASVSDSVSANFKVNDLTVIQLVLKEKLPWWRVLLQSMVIGYEHILPGGLDHILFVMGIYLAATRFRDLLWQVTSFTVAHSITLGLSMSGVLIAGPFWEQFVEIGIAISIFVVAFENCLWRQPPGWPRILIVGGFGLIHGMGFAGRLSEVKWPEHTFFLTLFGANMGIELGQMTVVAAASLVTAWWWKRSWYQSRIAAPVSLLIGLYGFFAALERISNLKLPSKEILDFLWGIYDHHYWVVPFGLGSIVVLLLWIAYRLVQVLPRYLKEKGRMNQAVQPAQPDDLMPGKKSGNPSTP